MDMTGKTFAYELVRYALDEDIGSGDITSEATISETLSGTARIFTRQKGIIAGTDITRNVFRTMDPDLKIKIDYRDGSKTAINEVVMVIKGRIRSILAAERVALNFLGHLSGIATLTGKFVDQVKGTRTKIIDTRKTTPLLRRHEKAAVVAGGGFNHRMGLYDMVLIKDNHVQAAGGINRAVGKTETYLGVQKRKVGIEVETRTMDEVRDALGCNIQRILLDNMTIAEIKEAVKLINKQVEVEVSGGVNLGNVREIALCGVDFISVGAITHSAPVFDFSLLVD
jgi:nicotinate-nucleotide pyrophosphorylase (carboxylating)